MSGLSVAIPLRISDVFGAYDLNTTFVELAKQNLKMVLLTVPGERIMYPNFGVGLSRYFWEQNIPGTYDDIRSKITEQVSIHLPYIRLLDIRFNVPENNPDLFPNTVSISIDFEITPIQTRTVLEIEVNN